MTKRAVRSNQKFGGVSCPEMQTNLLNILDIYTLNILDDYYRDTKLSENQGMKLITYNAVTFLIVMIMI